jgi:competence protein ComEA
MNRAQGAAGLALVLVAVVSGLWWGGRQPQAIRDPSMPGPSTSVATTSAAGPRITVHVAGFVSTPGLVELPDGSRVADAVAAAGGMLPGAAVDSINLAALLVDGQQVVVPGPGEGSASVGVDASETTVHLNSATAAELDALPGVGPVIAERIVAFRDENGPFQSVDDLLGVPGIGEAKLADLRDMVQVP